MGIIHSRRGACNEIQRLGISFFCGMLFGVVIIIIVFSRFVYPETDRVYTAIVNCERHLPRDQRCKAVISAEPIQRKSEEEE